MVHGPAGPERLPADLIHILPPYAAPEIVVASGLDADGTNGFIAVDPATLRHRVFRRVWAVGDACDLGDGRTGGALRHQVKIVIDNIQRSRRVDRSAITTATAWPRSPPHAASSPSASMTVSSASAAHSRYPTRSPPDAPGGGSTGRCCPRTTGTASSKATLTTPLYPTLEMSAEGWFKGRPTWTVRPDLNRPPSVPDVHMKCIGAWTDTVAGAHKTGVEVRRTPDPRHQAHHTCAISRPTSWPHLYRD